jgi:hypothetical protein
VSLRCIPLRLVFAIWIGSLGCAQSFAEERASGAASPGGGGGNAASTATGGSTSTKSGESGAKEHAAKEKPFPSQSAEKPKQSEPKRSEPKQSGSKEPQSKRPAGKEPGAKHIDTRLPGPPSPNAGPMLSHTPHFVPARPLSSALPSIGIPRPSVRPLPGAATGIPHLGSQTPEAAKSAFGAAAVHVPHRPATAGAPAPNRGVINGTAMARRGSGPATIGGPAKNAGVINGTTMRPRP